MGRMYIVHTTACKELPGQPAPEWTHEPAHGEEGGEEVEGQQGQRHEQYCKEKREVLYGVAKVLVDVI
jgi:hypothetical protein